MTLTLDQLRVWLERQEREASAAADGLLRDYRTEMGDRWFDPNSDPITAPQRSLWDQFLMARGSAFIARELLEAIEKGELPG